MNVVLVLAPVVTGVGEGLPVAPPLPSPGVGDG